MIATYGFYISHDGLPWPGNLWSTPFEAKENIPTSKTGPTITLQS